MNYVHAQSRLVVGNHQHQNGWNLLPTAAGEHKESNEWSQQSVEDPSVGPSTTVYRQPKSISRHGKEVPQASIVT
jgi:hypothetical protein